MTSFRIIAVLSASFVTLACTTMGSVQTASQTTVTEATAKQIAGDVPLPQGAVIKQQESLVMGSGTAWTGRLSVTVAGEPQQVFAWFRDGLPGAGWTLTSSSFSKLSLLTFTKADRIANVQMQAGSFGANDVLITVAPAVKPAASAPASRP